MQNIELNKYPYYIKQGFKHGFLQAFDLFGLFSRISSIKGNGGKTDYEALQSDWMKVGDDLRTALQKVEVSLKDGRKQ